MTLATEQADSEAWAAIRERSKALAGWTDRAVELATEAAAQKPPGRLAVWRGRRAAARADRVAEAHRLRLVDRKPATRPAKVADQAAKVASPAGGRLRYIPPVAALGTAFVLQAVAMTDMVGHRLAEVAAQSDVAAVADRPQLGYLAAMLLGIAVASCFEGAAAYLMDLYDKHLMAQDSVGVLRLAMVGYVAASAGVIHWWLAERDLPGIVTWVLAGMSASALFLWSRGSRWRHRAAMRAAGQLDPAMPRLPMAAKLFHPVRWVVTLYLVSWEPASTPAEARARYEQWSADRSATKAARSATKAAGQSTKADPPAPPAAIRLDYRSPIGPMPAAPVAPAEDHAATRGQVADRPTGQLGQDGHRPGAVADAAFLRTKYGDRAPGRNELYRVHGGNKTRWTKALDAYAARADQRPAT